jgi:hypothetical protein
MLTATLLDGGRETCPGEKGALLPLAAEMREELFDHRGAFDGRKMVSARIFLLDDSWTCLSAIQSLTDPVND